MSVLLLRRPVRRRSSGGGPDAETFTAASGSAWPADWVTASGSGSNNQQIQNNKARLTPANGWASAWRSGASTVTDFDLTVMVAAGAGMVIIGMSPAHTPWNTPDNSHYFRLNVESSQMGYVVLRKNTSSGGHADLTFQFAGVVPHSTDGWSVRFRRTGTTLYGKVWTARTTEPTPWLLQATDPAPPSTLAGKVFLGADVQTDFDNLTVTTGGGGGSASGFGTAPFGTAPFGV